MILCCLHSICDVCFVPFSPLPLLTPSFLILDQQTVELSPSQAELLLGQGEQGIESYTDGPCVGQERI